MDPYHRYAADPLKSRSLRQQGYLTDDINFIEQKLNSLRLQEEQPTGSSRPSLDPHVFCALIALGYSDDQAEAVYHEIKQLLKSFGSEWMLGECCSGPCGSWRAERVQLRDQSWSRFAYRIHVFEQSVRKERGRYLGYVMLRPAIRKKVSGFPYTTVATIAIPRFMLRPRYHIITCIGGPQDGILPFRSVPFCAPNEDTKNHASCLHAAVQQALLLKAIPFQCKPISSLDMITLLWKIEWERPGSSELTQFRVEDIDNEFPFLTTLEQSDDDACNRVLGLLLQDNWHDKMARNATWRPTKEDLVMALNRLVRGLQLVPSAFETKGHNDCLPIEIPLRRVRTATANRIEQKPKPGDDRKRANRMLLEDVFPHHIAQGRLSISDVSSERTSLNDALSVLQSKEVNSNGIVEEFRLRNYSTVELTKHEARRCMMDYLSNGMPLIVALRVKRSSEDVLFNPATNDTVGHSILVFGMHVLHNPSQRADGLPTGSHSHLVVDIYELPDRFVAHDIKRGPFAEWDADELLNAAWIDDPDIPIRSGITFLAITPLGMQTGLRRIRFKAMDEMGVRGGETGLAFWKNYVTRLGIPVEDHLLPDKESTRYLSRLLNSRQVVTRYLTADPDTGETIQWDRLNAIFPNVKSGSGKDLPGRYFWCVETRLPRELKMGVHPVSAESAQQLPDASHFQELSSTETDSNDQTSKATFGEPLFGDAPPALVSIWDVTQDEQDIPRLQLEYLGQDPQATGGERYAIRLNLDGNPEEDILNGSVECTIFRQRA